MKTWADEKGIIPPATSIDRDKGEGPAYRCCKTRHVAADSLVCFDAGELSETARGFVLGRFPRCVNAREVYLCGGCRETLRRERIVTREEMPKSRPLRFPNVR